MTTIRQFLPSVVAFQGAALAIALVLALFKPRIGDRWFRRVRRRCSFTVRRPGLAVVAVGVLAFSSSAAVSLLSPHVPWVQDEFSYLLAADTFARGRLTNPAHPMWEHFESPHVIQQPTYQSKYPPGQGLILAAGQVLAGHPIVGVWLSVGLACAALTWMLQAWVGRRWAVIGGLLPVVSLGLVGHWSGSLFMYWSRTYWGGMVAATGGALVFGAVRRLVMRPRARHSLVMGVGLVILATSRPYEGLIASVPAAVVLLAWMAGREGPAARVSVGSIVVPLAGVLVAGAAWIGYYNYRVTNDPLRMPYGVYQATYRGRATVLPRMSWQEPGPDAQTRGAVLSRHHGQLEEFYKQRRQAMQTVSGWLEVSWHTLEKLWAFYLGPLLSVPLLTAVLVCRQPWTWFAGLGVGLVVGMVLLVGGRWGHYLAPAYGLLLVLVVQGMRCLAARFDRARGGGRFLARALGVACVASAVLATARHAGGPSGDPRWSQVRARLLEELTQREGRHLVIVHYAGHASDSEWVYNEADIDTAKVVWAHDLGPEENRGLVQYFKDRTTWVLSPDSLPIILAPLESPAVRRAPGPSE